MSLCTFLSVALPEVQQEHKAKKGEKKIFQQSNLSFHLSRTFKRCPLLNNKLIREISTACLNGIALQIALTGSLSAMITLNNKHQGWKSMKIILLLEDSSLIFHYTYTANVLHDLQSPNAFRNSTDSSSPRKAGSIGNWKGLWGKQNEACKNPKTHNKIHITNDVQELTSR